MPGINEKDLGPPELHSASVNGIELAYAEWHPELKGERPSLVFTHATGFHGRVWDSVIARLPKTHTVSIDLRGHGRSNGTISSWQQIADDVSALLEHIKLSHWLGVGHSMGGHVLLRAICARQNGTQRLLLIDPMIASPERYKQMEPWFNADGSHPTARRKRYFSSVQEMVDRFQNRDPYKDFAESVMRDYCLHGLVISAAPKESLELACPPETEASVYLTSQASGGILDLLDQASIPVLIVRAPVLKERSFKSSPTWTQLANALPNAREVALTGNSHFFPFEAPDKAAMMIASELKKV